ncbi:MAG TPA: RlpA-like double-psi beta-barrel domain-containing protein [Acetobacteraceae bacterium]
MTAFRVLASVSLLCTLLGCATNEPTPHPHYVLGDPYQSGGVWWYPRDNLGFDETGLAAVYSGDHPYLTTDGEVFSQGAFASGQPTLQLPSIARLTDLQTGRSVLVRINDRGTPTPARLVQVTRRIADLLGMPRDGVAQVRLTILSVPTQEAESYVGGAPMPQVQAAPRGTVQSTDLAPLPGARQEGGRTVAAESVASAPPNDPAPQRLPETLTQGTPDPGRLWVRLDTFQSYEYAAIQRAKLSGLAPRIVSVLDGGAETFRVMAGPFDSVAQADAALDQAIRGGVPDARIVVE